MLRIRNYYEREAILEAMEQYIQNSEEVEDELSPREQEILAAAREVNRRAELSLVRELGVEVTEADTPNRFDRKWGNPRYL